MMSAANEITDPGDTSVHHTALMPLGEHLEDLRRRLIFSLLGLVPILLASLYFGKTILEFIITPGAEALKSGGFPPTFQVTSFFEGFNSYLKLSLAITILAGAPWVFYQLWRFIAPGLFSHERRFVYVLAPLSAVLTVCSACFLYYVMLPVVLLFFVTFNASLPAVVPVTSKVGDPPALPTVPMLPTDPESPPIGSWWINLSLSQLRFALPADALAVSAPEQQSNTDDAASPPRIIVRGVPLTGDQLISQQYRISEYVSMVLSFALALAAGFQMPVVVLLLGWARVINVQLLRKYRRHAVMVCVVLGAVLTPADPFSMLLLAIPLWMLFELGIVLLRWLPASRIGGWKDDQAGPMEPQDDPPI